LKKEHLENSIFGLAVLYSDIRHSTKIATKLKPFEQKLYYETFLNEMISIIEDFGGYPFKTTGDCVIGFFLEEHGFQWCDNVILCGQMMIEVVKNNISPYLQSKGLPKLECRIAADYGEAQIIKLCSQKLPFSLEVVGNVMNITAKILSKAETNQMFIGQNLAELIHTEYRVHCEHAGNLQFNSENYKFFKVNYQI
jgi:class 3 adenylate cyclase